MLRQQQSLHACSFVRVPKLRDNFLKGEGKWGEGREALNKVQCVL